MLYVVTYGCGCGDVEECVEAKSLQDAEMYAYDCAIENYESYEGLYGVLTKEEVCEDRGIEDVESEEAEEAYREHREGDINYGAEEFNEEDDFHQYLLEQGVIEI